MRNRFWYWQAYWAARFDMWKMERQFKGDLDELEARLEAIRKAGL